MATETLSARTARVALDNGTDSEGNPKTVNLTVPGISPRASDWDADKYLAVIAALGPCLSKTIEAAQTVATYTVTAN